jgi:ankyrin repeat protein
VQLAKFNESNVLHLAAKKGDPQVVEMLIHAGHDVNMKNWGGNTALLVASRFGCKAAVNLLLDAGSKMDDCNRLGHTALHYACFKGSYSIVRSLLSRGACADARTHLGINPIMLACEQNHCEIVNWLANKCDLNKQEKLYGAPVLHWAVSSGCVPCVQQVINEGAYVYALDKSGRSAIIQAIQSDKCKILELLLNYYNEDDFICSKCNYVVLHVAAFLGRLSCVEVLCTSLKTKHLVNAVDYFGETPLDMAIKTNQTDVVRYLEQLNAVKTVASTNESNDIVAEMSIPDSPALNADIETDHLQQGIDNININSIREDAESDKCLKSLLSSSQNIQILPVYKTYSAVKMSMIEMLRSVSAEQMVAKAKFNFDSWLDNGPEAFVLKVISLDITEWLHQAMHNPWSLREICRGKLRFELGYRAHEKVELLPLPYRLKQYLNMVELSEIDTKEIKIRNTHSYDDIEME